MRCLSQSAQYNRLATTVDEGYSLNSDNFVINGKCVYFSFLFYSQSSEIITLNFNTLIKTLKCASVVQERYTPQTLKSAEQGSYNSFFFKLRK